MTFAEICRRAGGRRAYNRKRRLNRQRRITLILRVQDEMPEASGRVLARALKVSEATISRDLRFIRRVRAAYARLFDGVNIPVQRMTSQSFRWTNDARGYQIAYHYKDGVRLR